MHQRIGLDWFDVGIHGFVTICLAVAMASPSGANEEVVIPLVFGSSAVVFAIRRKLALRRLPPALAPGEVEAARLDDVEQRLAEVDLLEARVAELENRVEFSERLLAQHRDAQLVRGDRA